MKQYVDRSYDYVGYTALLDHLLAEGKTTGPTQSGSMLEYGRINRQRMKRLTKTVAILPEVKEAAGRLRSPKVWLVITEGWCGDAAQNIPVIELVAAQSPQLETRYVLRDENLEFMDRFLTVGARSIPKLIAVDATTLEVKGTWGPRPAAAQKIYENLRSSNVPKAEIMERLQRWYNADGGRSAQAELAELILVSNTESVGAAA